MLDKVLIGCEAHNIFLQKKLNEALSAPVEALLDEAGDDTWPAIRRLLRRETESAVSGFSEALSSFDIDEEAKDKMISSLEDYARGTVQSKAKEEAGRVLLRMKDRSYILVSKLVLLMFIKYATSFICF